MEEDVEDDALETEMDPETDTNRPDEVWLPHLRPLAEGETLEHDPSAYDMLHFFSSEWPCLSFDIIPDKLGFQREKFPHTMYLVAGTQASHESKNSIVLMKLSDLSKTRENEDSDGEFDFGSGESSGGDDDPIMETKLIKHSAGTINRIRVMPQQPHIVGCMNENSSVTIYDLKESLAGLDHPRERVPNSSHDFVFDGHPSEGYGISWNPKVEGRLITSDCARNIFWWNPVEGGKWSVDMVPFSEHGASVEDLQWSPSEPDVFASCSVDKTVKLWDARKGKRAVATIQAHDSDVNVLSWNHKRAFLILTGADDGCFRIWDLRKLRQEDMKADFSFNWHSQAITSVEWCPNDDSTLSVSSVDNSISLWDLSLTTEKTKVKDVELPSQLMFLHHGQKFIKEVHWHRQIPGVLVPTALDGFNVFKSCNI
eukprot:TRINITY_DN2478_c0_g2_i4.p1 TRINITY_DN2478_c0_g2~~TRINITY_DN2478_c0_g2_i4.p1  ORF type:complete len:426 (-),score=73.51 TRINITY_DN2478_c0_g2_i4:60-1337(-)